MHNQHPVSSVADGSQLLTIPQACHRLAVGRSTFYNIISSGKLTLRKIGGASRVRADELEAYIVNLPALGASK